MTERENLADENNFIFPSKDYFINVFLKTKHYKSKIVIDSIYLKDDKVYLVCSNCTQVKSAARITNNSYNIGS